MLTGGATAPPGAVWACPRGGQANVPASSIAETKVHFLIFEILPSFKLSIYIPPRITVVPRYLPSHPACEAPISDMTGGFDSWLREDRGYGRLLAAAALVVENFICLAIDHDFAYAPIRCAALRYVHGYRGHVSGFERTPRKPIAHQGRRSVFLDNPVRDVPLVILYIHL